MTDIDSKLRTTWNVRAMPSAQRAAAGSAVTSAPSKTTVPLDAGSEPAITLNSVDLPAPFGPIRPTISPCATLIDTSSLATRPPNQRDMCRTSSKDGVVILSRRAIFVW